jgi:hypothetical protein
MKRTICYFVIVNFFFVLLINNSVHAGVKCSGTVKTLAIGPQSGLLQVSTGYGVHYLCKLNESWNGVSPDVCKVWYSMFLAAKLSGKKIAQYYDEGAECSADSLGNWQVPTPFPYFVEIED